MPSYTAVTSPECPGCASTITLLYKYRWIGKMVQNIPSIMNQQFVFNQERKRITNYRLLETYAIFLGAILEKKRHFIT